MSTAPDITDLQIQLAEAKAGLYIPGAWHCEKCTFSLSLSLLHAKSGNISPNLSHEAPVCPNDGAPMIRETWQHRCESLSEMFRNWSAQRAILSKAVKFFGDGYNACALDPKNAAHLNEIQKIAAMLDEMRDALK